MDNISTKNKHDRKLLKMLLCVMLRIALYEGAVTCCEQFCGFLVQPCIITLAYWNTYSLQQAACRMTSVFKTFFEPRSLLVPAVAALK